MLLTSGAQEGIPLLPGKARFAYDEGTVFSVIAFTELPGLTVAGARWPLDRVTVPFGSSWTISNKVRGDLAIDLAKGRAMLIAHPFPPSISKPLAPPLLKLDAIRLTFGGTPLLDGAALSVGQGERIALVGRNGSGKSTLLKIAAGLVEPQDGEVFRQPTATVRYLPQVPDIDGFATVRAYVEAGLGPADDPHRATYLLRSPRADGRRGPGHPLRRRSPPRGAGAGHGAGTRYPAARRADQPSRPLHHRVAGRRTDPHHPPPLVVISHDRRFLERVSRATVWLDRGETRRLDKGFAAFRGMARHHAGRGRARPAQARPPDRSRRALAALRRDGAAQAQYAPARRTADHAPALSRPSRRRKASARWRPATRPSPASW